MASKFNVKSINAALTEATTDYTLANPDTLTKYKQAGEISQNVLKTVSSNPSLIPLRCSLPASRIAAATLGRTT